MQSKKRTWDVSVRYKSWGALNMLEIITYMQRLKLDKDMLGEECNRERI